MKRPLGQGGNGRCKVPEHVRKLWGGPRQDRDHACAYYAYGTSRRKAAEAPQESLF